MWDILCNGAFKKLDTDSLKQKVKCKQQNI